MPIKIKDNDEWKEVIPYVKHENEWKECKVFINIQGEWKELLKDNKELD